MFQVSDTDENTTNVYLNITFCLLPPDKEDTNQSCKLLKCSLFFTVKNKHKNEWQPFNIYVNMIYHLALFL